MRIAALVVLCCASATAQPAPPPLYFDRAITDADLKGRTLRELTLLRNTIFARTGHTFRKPWLAQYFASQPWYVPRKTPDKTVLTRTDWENARRIGEAEANQDKATLLARAAAIRARQAAGKATAVDLVEVHLVSARLGRWVGDAAATTKRSPFEDPGQLDRQLTAKELESLSRRDLRLLRNMVFARRGYTFKSELLRGYFEDTDWYRPDPAYSTKRLTPLDWRNVKLVKSVESSLGGALTDHAHKTEDGWFAEA